MNRVQKKIRSPATSKEKNNFSLGNRCHETPKNSSSALFDKENLPPYTPSQILPRDNRSVATSKGGLTPIEKFLVAKVRAIDEQVKRNGDVLDDKKS